MTTIPDAPINPGDEAPVGTPGTGEDVCPVCQGTGLAADADADEGEKAPCPNCGGTGVITEGIGGG
jgi:DnaJ-class molecular chaperone